MMKRGPQKLSSSSTLLYNPNHFVFNCGAWTTRNCGIHVMSHCRNWLIQTNTNANDHHNTMFMKWDHTKLKLKKFTSVQTLDLSTLPAAEHNCLNSRHTGTIASYCQTYSSVSSCHRTDPENTILHTVSITGQPQGCVTVHNNKRSLANHKVVSQCISISDCDAANTG